MIADVEARLSIANVDTGEVLEVLANPTEITEARAASFARIQAIGLGHRPLHYAGSDNATWRTSLWIDRHVATERGGAFDPDGFARFLRALTVPGLVLGEPAPAPPKAVLVWPGVLNATVFLTSLSLRFEEFGSDARPTRYVATCEFEEALSARIFSEQIRGAS